MVSDSHVQPKRKPFSCEKEHRNSLLRFPDKALSSGRLSAIRLARCRWLAAYSSPVTDNIILMTPPETQAINLEKKFKSTPRFWPARGRTKMIRRMMKKP